MVVVVRASELRPDDIIRLAGWQSRFCAVEAVHRIRTPSGPDVMVVLTDRFSVLHLNVNLPVWRLQVEVPDTVPDDWSVDGPAST